MRQEVAAVSEWLGPGLAGWRDASMPRRCFHQFPCHPVPAPLWVYPRDQNAGPVDAFRVPRAAVSRRKGSIAGNELAGEAKVAADPICVTVKKGCSARFCDVAARRPFRERERMASGLSGGRHLVGEP